MIASEKVNEFIYNMKFSRSIIGGMKEESVYDNMKKLSDLYEEQITALTMQLKEIKEKADLDEKAFKEMKEKHSEEMETLRRNCKQVLTIHQGRINRFMEECSVLTAETANAIENNKL